MTIDAHFHLWDLARPECLWPTADEAAIHRDHLLPEYRSLAEAAGISAAILVQTQESIADTEWLLALACDEALIGAVVGWADLAEPGAATTVRALSERPKLRGLRPMVQDREADWYEQAQLDPALELMSDKNMTLDALVREMHLPSLERLARRFPRLAIVIDHAAKPRIGTDRGFEDWYEAIARLAESSNVHCKLSGLLTECPPGEADEALLVPYVAALLDLFGVERLMWGSDWPVLNMAGDLAGWLDIAHRLVPAQAHRAVFEDTAVAFYGLAGRTA